jgi:hypothetical protein
VFGVYGVYCNLEDFKKSTKPLYLGQAVARLLYNQLEMCRQSLQCWPLGAKPKNRIIR